MDPLPERAFLPTTAFVQTCGACGSTFRVEVERPRSRGEQQEYVCPCCRDHVCRVSASTPPRITLLTMKQAKERHS